LSLDLETIKTVLVWEEVPVKRSLTYLGRLIFAAVVVFLLGSGIWANLTKAPLSEMRGMWVNQAMRGMVY
jgi:hypothetical protein